MRYRSKYNAKKVVTEDGTFDSQKEYKRYLYLKELESKGEIDKLQRQHPFELIPHQVIDGKVVERAVKYFADFTYFKDGEFVVEDTKGYKTPDYIIKRKLMLDRFGIRITEV